MSENKVRVTLVLTQTVLFGKVMAKECDAMANFDERYFNSGSQQEYDTSLVGECEQILWQGKPNRKAFIRAGGENVAICHFVACSGRRNNCYHCQHC